MTVLSANAWVVALVVVAVSCAVIALVAVLALFVLLGVARRLARMEGEFGRVVEEARRETAATLQSVRGAVDEVHELAGTARRLGTELPLAVALGWLGAQKGLPAAMAGAVTVFKGLSSRRIKRGQKKEKGEQALPEGQERPGEPERRGQPAPEPTEAE